MFLRTMGVAYLEGHLACKNLCHMFSSVLFWRNAGRKQRGWKMAVEMEVDT